MTRSKDSSPPTGETINCRKKDHRTNLSGLSKDFGVSKSPPSLLTQHPDFFVKCAGAAKLDDDVPSSKFDASHG